MKGYIDKLKDMEFQEPDNPAQKLHDDAYDRCISKYNMIFATSFASSVSNSA